MKKIVEDTEILIVGSGPCGMILADRLAARGRQVTVLESGPARSYPPGQHLRPQCRSTEDWLVFRGGLLRPMVSPPGPATLLRGFEKRVALHPQSDASGAETPLPALAGFEAVGGAGIVWSGHVPRFQAFERWPLPEGCDWDGYYSTTEKALRVQPAAESPLMAEVLRALLRAGFDASPAPISGMDNEHPFGPSDWTRCAQVRAGQLVIGLDCQGGRAVSLRSTDNAGNETEWRFDHAVVAGGAIWSAQILSSLEVCSDLPIGRYACDHPVAHARLVLDLARIEASDVRLGPIFLQIPATEAVPCHTIIAGSEAPEQGLGGRVDSRRVLDLYCYSAVVPNVANRVEFGPDRDTRGLPAPRFSLVLSEEDQRRAAQAVDQVTRIAEALGPCLPNTRPRQLPGGTAQHLTGTLALGAVTEGLGALKGIAALSAVGTALIPTATASNPTLSALALARALADRL